MLLYLQEIAINRCVLLPGPALTRPGVQGAEPAGVGGSARGSPGPGGHRHRPQRVRGGAAALHVGATTAYMASNHLYLII